MKGHAPWLPEVSVWLAGLGLTTVTGAIAVACTLDNRATGPAGTGGATTSAGIGGNEGGYGIGGGGGGAGGGEPEALESWEAGAPEADGTYLLPSWLVLESPSADKSVQVGPHELKTGFGPDAARARNVGGGWGLTLERERTNRILHSRVASPSWTLTSATTLLQIAGPDGEESATRVDEQNPSAIGAAFSAIEPGPEGVDATLSLWLSGVPDDRQAFIGASMLVPRGLATQASEWTRVSITGSEGVESTSNPRAQLYPAYGDAANTGAADFAFVSFETGKYPSSPIVTAGAPVTRLAESLSIPNNPARELIPGGRFHVKLVFTPHYAKGEQETDHDLFFVDDTHRVYLSAAPPAVVVAAGEPSTLSTGALTWRREEQVTVEVLSTAAALRLRVTTEAGTADVSTEAPVSAFEIPGEVHVLGNATGSQEGADLRSITFFEPE
jgi:hypothetical protein